MVAAGAWAGAGWQAQGSSREGAGRLQGELTYWQSKGLWGAECGRAGSAPAAPELPVGRKGKAGSPEGVAGTLGVRESQREPSDRKVLTGPHSRDLRWGLRSRSRGLRGSLSGAWGHLPAPGVCLGASV